MPTVRLLRTSMGGYEFINLTSALLNPFFRKVDISAQVDGFATTFSTAVVAIPFVAGSLELLLGGELQNGYIGVTITEHPALGTFDLNFAPQVVNLPLVVRFVAA